MTSGTARWWWLGAGAALTLWIVTAFAFAWPTGWVHAFLVAGVGAVVRAIVEGDQGRTGATTGEQGRTRASTGGDRRERP
jgi:hypothetical protein